MGFVRIKTMIDACGVDGQYQYSSFRKVPSQASVAGNWVDLSMASGNPVPNFYAANPLEANTLDGRKGLYHGNPVSPKTKHLAKVTMMTATANAVPIAVKLLDYLLFYPFVDMDSIDLQEFVNYDVDVSPTTPTLPRYTDGKGVQIMMVAQAPYTGNVTFRVYYTNSEGVTGRVTPDIRMGTAGLIASLITGGNIVNACGPFLPLQSGDLGVRKIDSIQFDAPGGGLCAIVLVKPLANHMIREITAPNERCYAIDEPSMPRIVDGAYLNFIVYPRASIAAAPIIGDLWTVWN